MSSRNFRRRNHRRHGPGSGQAEPREPRVFPDCPVCGKPVRELPSALSHKATGTPAHFDCVLKELREAHELMPQERLCYLGSGNFAILTFKSSGSSAFTIRKKIPYEDKETPQDWKRALLVSN